MRNDLIVTFVTTFVEINKLRKPVDVRSCIVLHLRFKRLLVTVVMK